MPTHKKIVFDFIDDQELLNVDFDRMERAIAKILADAGVTAGKIEIAVVAAEPMHAMNVEFLGHDYPTDVLAFPMDGGPGLGYLEGNIVVCSDVAAERAKDYGWGAEEELLLYAIHGALHLVGYDDHAPEDAPEMHAKEREYLQYVGVDGSRSRNE